LLPEFQEYSVAASEKINRKKRYGFSRKKSADNSDLLPV